MGKGWRGGTGRVLVIVLLFEEKNTKTEKQGEKTYPQFISGYKYATENTVQTSKRLVILNKTVAK